MNHTASSPVTFILSSLAFVLSLSPAFSTTLHVGAGQQYTDVAIAVRAATPGDTVLIHEGNYTGTFWIENVHGTADAYITIRGIDPFVAPF
jgi:hypothetical protein